MGKPEWQAMNECCMVNLNVGNLTPLSSLSARCSLGNALSAVDRWLFIQSVRGLLRTQLPIMNNVDSLFWDASKEVGRSTPILKAARGQASPHSATYIQSFLCKHQKHTSSRLVLAVSFHHSTLLVRRNATLTGNQGHMRACCQTAACRWILEIGLQLHGVCLWETHRQV